MPMPNDFRAIGPLGGFFAGSEFAAEREKQDLANALTQAQTAQQQQQTGQLEALLPFLLQQREQENTIRAKEAGLAQATMGNIPQEATNQGLAAKLAGLTAQGNIDSFPETQALASAERKGKRLSLEQENQLRALEQIDFIMQSQGNLAAATTAKELGMNPEVLFQDPNRVKQAISALKAQMVNTPKHMQEMSKEELKAATDIEQSNIAARASTYGADQSRIAREKEAESRVNIKATAVSLDKGAREDIQKLRDAEDRNAPPEEIEKLRERAQQSYLAATQYRAAAQQQGVVLDPDTGTLSSTRPGGAAPQLPLTPKQAGSGGNPQAGGSTPKRIQYDAQGNRIQ